MYFIDLLNDCDLNQVVVEFMKLMKPFTRKRRIRKKQKIKLNEVFNAITYKIQPVYYDEFKICIEYVSDEEEDLHYEDVYGLDLITNTKYGLEINPWEQTLGYLVDDSSVAQYGKERFAALVLWEMTWFGYSNEAIQKKLQVGYKSAP